MFAAATTQDCESEYLIDAFLLWWSEQRRKNGTPVAYDTGVNYSRDLRHFAASGNSLTNLDLPTARRYISRRRRRNGDPIGIEQAKVIQRALKAYTRHRAEDYGEVDGLASWRYPASPDPVGGKIASPEEVAKLMRSIERDKSFRGQRDLAIVGVFWSSGARPFRCRAAPCRRR